MKVLENLHPRRVFHYFEALCAIPHGSGNTAAVSAYCMEVANSLGLEARQDEAGNVVIRKPATPGYETHPPVILQAHLDMVCEKDPEVAFDFATEGLRLLVEGDWLTADGTTLGGDDGIGVAMILALLEANDLPHPPLEALFTTDEETGMGGALALDGSWLAGRRMINLDCDEEGIFTVGCAGGARVRLSLPLTWAANTAPCWEVTIEGLAGGHSGVEIHTGRQNANKLMGALLTRLPEGWRLVDMDGGRKDNVITPRCVCTVACASLPEDVVAAFVAQHRTPADPELTVTVRAVPVAEKAADTATSAAVARFLEEAPYGVQAMHAQLPDLVETSLNLGVLRVDEGTLTATFSVRSAVEEKKQRLLSTLRELAAAYGGTCVDGDHYPAWEYREQSPLRQVMLDTYRQVTGREPVAAAIHAGLECGLLGEKLPGLDTVAMGPDLRDIHSPKERLSISSVERTYRYLRAVLEVL